MSDEPPADEPQKKPMTGREAYNLTADTVAGVNFRLRDNLLQGCAILVFVLAGALVGALTLPTPHPLIGAAVGGFGGLVVGFFVSGFILMIYRAVQHARGKHD